MTYEGMDNKHPDEKDVGLLFSWLGASGLSVRNKVDILGQKIIFICTSRLTDTEKMGLLVLVRDRMAAKDGGLDPGRTTLLYTHQHRCIDQYLRALGHHRAREMSIPYDPSDPWNMVRQGDGMDGCGGGVKVERCYVALGNYNTRRRCRVCGGFVSIRHHSEPFTYHHPDLEGEDDEELGRPPPSDKKTWRKKDVANWEIAPGSEL